MANLGACIRNETVKSIHQLVHSVRLKYLSGFLRLYFLSGLKVVCTFMLNVGLLECHIRCRELGTSQVRV